jgi:general stress protein CsbA
VLAFGLFFKAIAVLVVLFAAAARDSHVALATVLVFGLAYTLDRGLQLATYFGAAR